MDRSKLALWEKRLAEWRHEGETNQFGMARFAERAIKILETDIVALRAQAQEQK